MIKNGLNDQNVFGHVNATEHEGSYIFEPSQNSRKRIGSLNQPSKRQKTSHEASFEQASGLNAPFQSLFGGREASGLKEVRQKAFELNWGLLEHSFKKVLDNVNNSTLNHITSFVRKADSRNYEGRIPSGLVLTGPNIAYHGSLFKQLASKLREDGNECVVIKSESNTNLKTLLRTVISSITHSSSLGDDPGYDHRRGKGSKYLNYDLRGLHEHVVKNKVERLGLIIQDSEAFDGNLLADFICTLHPWIDRIPTVLLFGIATSVDIFHDKLSTAAVRCLRGERFDVDRSEETLERLFTAALSSDAKPKLGPVVARTLLDRQRDHIQSADAFTSSMKYCYMCHYYSNPLTILLFERVSEFRPSLTSEHFSHLRNLPSFHRLVERKLGEKNSTLVRSLLESDEIVLDHFFEATQDYSNFTSSLKDIIEVAHVTCRTLRPQEPLAKSDLYVPAISGELLQKPVFREMLLLLKRTPSNVLLDLLDSLRGLSLEDSSFASQLNTYHHELKTLTDQNSESDSKPLRNEEDVRHQTTRTTVISQRIELHRQKSSLSQQDTDYSRLAQNFRESFEHFFEERLARSMWDTFGHEISFYDLKSSQREAFAPRPRLAIERAFSAPHDYLNCPCCKPGETLARTQPPTSILYHLYLESGSLINVFDLWSAFYATIGGEDGSGCVERLALALFYRGLAELKQMGMVKPSRKKSDHIAKFAWKGL